MENVAYLGGDALMERALIAAAPFAKAFLGLSTITVIAQALPVDPIGTQIEHLGMMGMLGTGVVVLWRMLWAQHKQHKDDLRAKDDRLEKKDDQMLAMARTQTEALVTVSNVNTELRAAFIKGQEDLLKEVRQRHG